MWKQITTDHYVGESGRLTIFLQNVTGRWLVTCHPIAVNEFVSDRVDITAGTAKGLALRVCRSRVREYLKDLEEAPKP